MNSQQGHLTGTMKNQSSFLSVYQSYKSCQAIDIIIGQTAHAFHISLYSQIIIM